MIEVEIRGQLSREGYDSLKEHLQKDGAYLGRTEREMFCLRDFPGYSHDPVTRQADIRLRNTSGECEIMLKTSASDTNLARREISLKLKDKNLENAKEIIKALGFKTANRMYRIREEYQWNNIHWLLAQTSPKPYFYYEAELEVNEKSEIPDAHQKLLSAARELGLSVLSPEETREFIYLLDTEVNEEVRL